MTGKLIVLLLWYLALSLMTYVVYAIDKRAARSRRYRVSERQLHCWALVGGWPGAMLAQRRLRHKTIKSGFRFWYRLSVMGNLLALISLAALFHRLS